MPSSPSFKEYKVVIESFECAQKVPDHDVPNTLSGGGVTPLHCGTRLDRARAMLLHLLYRAEHCLRQHQDHYTQTLKHLFERYQALLPQPHSYCLPYATY